MKNILTKKFIGDRAFYRRVLAIAVPIMVQSGITNFVSLLDNIMVGRTGTEQMSGVAIVNQLIFVFYLCCFGGFSGAGIFTAQYYGAKDDEGIRHTFRYKLWLGFVLVLAAVVVLGFFGEDLISLYLRGTNDGGDPAAALAFGGAYLKIMLLINIAYQMGQIVNTVLIASIFRCGGNSKYGMILDIICMWCFAVPLGLISAFVLKLPPLIVYVLMCTDEFAKMPFAVSHYLKGGWIHNITRDKLE